MQPFLQRRSRQLSVIVGVVVLAATAVFVSWSLQGENDGLGTAETEAATNERNAHNERVIRDSTPLQKKLAAVVMAEAWRGQEADIRWIYFNLVNELGPEEGLKKSSAYKFEKPWFKTWINLLDHGQYATDVLPDDKYFKGQTVREFCSAGYMANEGLDRIIATLALVREMFEPGAVNPYPGWTGQGNIADFNHDERYWKTARQYYWLQQSGHAKEKLVHVLEADKYTQFLFHGNAIRAYAEQNPQLFPESVASFSLPDDTSVAKASE